jgi:hypothetical protein
VDKLQAPIQRQRVPRALGIALILVVLIIPLAATVSMERFGVTFTAFDKDVSNIPPAKIEAFADLRLPASATDLQSHLSGFQDESSLRVRFAILPSDLQSFMRTTRFTEPLSSSGIPDLIAEPFDLPWWKPRTVQHYLAGKTTFQREDAGRQYQAILIDTSDPQRYIVYLMVFAT